MVVQKDFRPFSVSYSLQGVLRMKNMADQIFPNSYMTAHIISPENHEIQSIFVSFVPC